MTTFLTSSLKTMLCYTGFHYQGLGKILSKYFWGAYTNPTCVVSALILICLTPLKRRCPIERSKHLRCTHLGPFHTRAKSHDHEIVRAQRKMSKGHFKRPPKSCTIVWSWTLKCSVKSDVTGPPTKCYFNEFPFMRVLTHDKIEQNNIC